jgi:hypothetical protein
MIQADRATLEIMIWVFIAWNVALVIYFINKLWPKRDS